MKALLLTALVVLLVFAGGVTAGNVLRLKYWHPNGVIKCSSLVGAPEAGCYLRYQANTAGIYFVNIDDRKFFVGQTPATPSDPGSS